MKILGHPVDAHIRAAGCRKVKYQKGDAHGIRVCCSGGVELSSRLSEPSGQSCTISGQS